MTVAGRGQPLRWGLAIGLMALSWIWGPLGWQQVAALWPGLLALMLVLILRRVFLSLVLGGLGGCVITVGGNPVEALVFLLQDLIIPLGSSNWKLGALAFTLILGGMARLIEVSGGLGAVLDRLLRGGGTDPSRKVQRAALGLGLICFFDGLANSMLVGRLMRGTAAPAGLSRLKLAYIVDATSSAVACLAVISTWIAFQLSMIRQGYEALGLEVDAYRLFVTSIPFNFYCWFTLGLLVLSIERRFNPGPMGAVERAAFAAERSPASQSAPRVGRLAAALVPLGVLIFSLLIGLYLSGAEDYLPITLNSLSLAFGRADAATVLVVSSLIAALTAALYLPRRADGPGPMRAFAQGAATLFGPALVLIGAWVLGGAMQALGTSEVIVQAIGDGLSPALLPAVIFLVGAILSFITGTSWGTMGILMPLAIPVAYALGGDAGAGLAQMPAVVAAVFSGAVFGDHCSPISDTTLVSSIATGVDPVDHVRTQLPFALLAATVALVVGFLPVGLGLGPWLPLAGGVLCLWLLSSLGKRRAV